MIILPANGVGRVESKPLALLIDRALNIDGGRLAISNRFVVPRLCTRAIVEIGDRAAGDAHVREHCLVFLHEVLVGHVIGWHRMLRIFNLLAKAEAKLLVERV